MNTNIMGCMQMQEKNSNVVKQIQLGNTTVKFCDNCIAKTKEDRLLRIKEFKNSAIRLLESTLINTNEERRQENG